MRFNKLDLNLLVALDAMLTEASISRAAERLHMTQSAMSNALARLREYFDDELLVQVGRRMEKTPRAWVLRDAVRDILLRIDTTLVTPPEFLPSKSDREFRIYVSDFTLATLVPCVLARGHVEAPSVRFVFVPQLEDPSRALERGEIDLLVIPQDYQVPGHPSAPLLTETFACVVWNQSSFASGTLTFDQYANAGHVAVQLVVNGTSLTSFEGWFVQRYGLHRRDEVMTFSFSAAPGLVVGTDRIATVHSRLARIAANHLPVVLHEPPIPFPEMKQVMQWNKHRSKDPGLGWLREAFLLAVEDMDREINLPS